MRDIIISGSFDDIRTADISFLKAAAEKGRVRLLLWTDGMCIRIRGAGPKFNLKERQYFTEAISYIDEVIIGNEGFDADSLPQSILDNADSESLWFVNSNEANDVKKAFCAENELSLATAEIKPSELQKYAETVEENDRKKIIVTGCYDYFHTGHIRFFEEVSEHGDLYVVIGSDKNVQLLKGEDHPHYKEDERLSIVQSIKYVKGAYVSTGSGWMDAEPEIGVLKPDIYAVNEDGDKPEKREFCEKHGLQYLILKRTPKEGLPARSSTDLRGF